VQNILHPSEEEYFYLMLTIRSRVELFTATRLFFTEYVEGQK